MNNALFALILLSWCSYSFANLNSSLEDLPEGLLDPASYEQIKAAPLFKSDKVGSFVVPSTFPRLPQGFGLAGEQQMEKADPAAQTDNTGASEAMPTAKETATLNRTADLQTVEQTEPVVQRDLPGYELDSPPLYQESVPVDASLSPLSDEQRKVRDIVLSHSKDLEPKEEKSRSENKSQPKLEKQNAVRLPSGNWQGSTQVYSR